MTKTRGAMRSRQILGVFGVCLASLAHGQSFNENFDDISLLPGRGWTMKNLSQSATNDGPLGAAWYQGNLIPNIAAITDYPAQSGGYNSFLSTGWPASSDMMDSVTLSDWAFSPVRTLRNGDSLSFYTRSGNYGGNTIYPDRLEVRLSTFGTGTNVGATPTSTGDFSTLLLTINPNLTTSGYPQTWTRYSITLSGLQAATTGRFAFRYYVTGGGFSGPNSLRIGIDTLSYTSAVPEPATILALMTAFAGMACRLKRP